MLEATPYSELQRWFLYYQGEPFGWEVEEFRHAQVCQVVSNAPHYQWDKCIKITQPFKLNDFYLDPGKKDKPQQPSPAKKPPSPEDIKNAFFIG